MPKYRVQYTFDGYGECLIEASNESEAIKKYEDGDFEDLNEDQNDNYCFNSIEEIA